MRFHLLLVLAITFYQTKAFEINGTAQQFNGREGVGNDFFEIIINPLIIIIISLIINGIGVNKYSDG
jgi:hypothetical protein